MIRRGARITRKSPYRPVPQNLGASLLAFWDAERSDLITQSGGTVSNWLDSVAGYNLAQATGASKPTYGATSFNGRPGINFDGVDDFLNLESQPFPSGENGCEIWWIGEQLAPASDANIRYLFCYGGNSANNGRMLSRLQSASRPHFRTGTGASSVFTSPVGSEFIGRCCARAIIAPTQTTMANGSTNYIRSLSVAGIPATGTTRVRLGANLSNTASQFGWMQTAMLAVTDLLSDQQAADMWRYSLARGV